MAQMMWGIIPFSKSDIMAKVYVQKFTNTLHIDWVVLPRLGLFMDRISPGQMMFTDLIINKTNNLRYTKSTKDLHAIVYHI